MAHSRIVEEEQAGWWIVEVLYSMFWFSSIRGTEVEKKGNC